MLVGKAAKATGCVDIDAQVRSINVKSNRKVHVYGHSPRAHAAHEEGILYVNHYHGDDGGKDERAPLFLIHDGKAIVQRTVEIYDGPIRT